ncbi:MAG TPA: hypothetical protein VIN40_11165 [Candidatus Tyrphobacter sp.]
MPSALRPLDHLVTLSDDVGVIQHAVENVPNRSTGYCTDDIARALMVAIARLRIVPKDAQARRLAGIYLAFLHDAQLSDGRFHNFMSYDRRWLDEVGTHDSNGRALWGLGYAMRYAPDAGWQRTAKHLFERGLAAVEWLDYPHSEAYAMLGLANAQESSPQPAYAAALRALGRRSLDRLAAASDASWTWFDDVMTYDVARLPEALLRAGLAICEETFVEAGLLALEFYESAAFERRIFVPIGNAGWYRRGGDRARYDQQPLEAAAMVDGELAALEATGLGAHQEAAHAAMAWYEGANTEGIVMEHDGGCYDGLSMGCVNRNMGAESTLALLSASYAVALRRKSRIAVAR